MLKLVLQQLFYIVMFCKYYNGVCTVYDILSKAESGLINRTHEHVESSGSCKHVVGLRAYY